MHKSSFGPEMSSSYLDQKLAEALATTGYSVAAAKRTVIDWAMRDGRLLRELAGPFLVGIVGHAVDRAFRKAAKPSIVKSPPPISGSVLDRVVQTLGENFTRSGALPGAKHMPAAHAAASVRHADTIRSLAKAHIRNR
jgi:hypothetical protein